MVVDCMKGGILIRIARSALPNCSEYERARGDEAYKLIKVKVNRALLKELDDCVDTFTH